MLSDREREVLRGLEQQFSEEDLASHRRFSEQHGAAGHTRAGYLAGIGICALFTLLMLMADSGFGAAIFFLVGLALAGLWAWNPTNRNGRDQR